ncbi:hypothetical protein JG688_00016248, partial [Phytophthora aleatoria]
MAMSHRKIFEPGAAEAHLRAHLEDKTKQPDAEPALRANIEFWTRLRAILAANEGSYGLEALANLALALMDEDSRGQAVLEAVVLILSSPVLLHVGQAQASEIFQENGMYTVRPPSRSITFEPLRSLPTSSEGLGLGCTPESDEVRTDPNEDLLFCYADDDKSQGDENHEDQKDDDDPGEVDDSTDQKAPLRESKSDTIDLSEADQGTTA